MSKRVTKPGWMILMLLMATGLIVFCNRAGAEAETFTNNKPEGATFMKNSYGTEGIYFLPPEAKQRVQESLKEVKPESLNLTLLNVIDLENRNNYTRYIAQELINRGADVNFVFEIAGLRGNSLTLALVQNFVAPGDSNLEIICFLLKNGADVNAEVTNLSKENWGGLRHTDPPVALKEFPDNTTNFGLVKFFYEKISNSQEADSQAFVDLYKALIKIMENGKDQPDGDLALLHYMYGSMYDFDEEQQMKDAVQ